MVGVGQVARLRGRVEALFLDLVREVDSRGLATASPVATSPEAFLRTSGNGSTEEDESVRHDDLLGDLPPPRPRVVPDDAVQRLLLAELFRAERRGRAHAPP